MVMVCPVKLPVHVVVLVLAPVTSTRMYIPVRVLVVARSKHIEDPMVSGTVGIRIPYRSMPVHHRVRV
jgi:hypothetical protein